MANYIGFVDVQKIDLLGIRNVHLFNGYPLEDNIEFLGIRHFKEQGGYININVTVEKDCDSLPAQLNTPRKFPLEYSWTKIN